MPCPRYWNTRPDTIYCPRSTLRHQPFSSQIPHTTPLLISLYPRPTTLYHDHLPCVVCSLQCVVCRVQCIVCCVQCVECSVSCVVCRVQCVVCSIQSVVFSMQCVVCSVQYVVCSVQCVVCSVQFAVCRGQLQWAVCSVRCSVCGVQCVVCAGHPSISNTVQISKIWREYSSDTQLWGRREQGVRGEKYSSVLKVNNTLTLLFTYLATFWIQADNLGRFRKIIQLYTSTWMYWLLQPPNIYVQNCDSLVETLCKFTPSPSWIHLFYGSILLLSSIVLGGV